MDEILGLLGHPGGILVDHPRLRVGLVAAVSRPGSLELELIGRSPHTAESRTDPPAPRVLLPRYDEGLNLRVAWLDAGGRPHWEYGDVDVGTGPAFRGSYVHTRLRLPPMFDTAKIVLAWPEIGFPEAVVTLSLPGREAVAVAAVSVWTAPVDNRPHPPRRNAGERGQGRAAGGRERRTDGERGQGRRAAGASHPGSGPAHISLDVHPEAGLVLGGQRVLHRGDDAVVVLTRLTSVGSALSIEVLSIARGRRGGAATMASMHGPGPRRGNWDDPREAGIGASVGLFPGDASRGDRTGADVGWLAPSGGSASGGDDSFTGRAEYAFERPDSAFLDLVVGWPATDLADVDVRLPLYT